MRWTRRLWLIPLVTVLLALAACGGEDAGTAGANGGDNFGVMVLTSAHPFYQAYAQHWKELAGDQGFEVAVLDSQLKVETQQSNFEDLLTRGVEGIAVSPVDAASVVPLLTQAESQDIAVATVAVETEEAPVVVEGAYEAGFQGGVAAAKWLKKNHPEWAVKMAIVDFPIFQQTVDRADGFVAGVQSIAKDAEVVARQDGGGVLDQSTKVAENMLQAHPEANVWFGINDDSALGALNALKAADRGTTETELLVGFDGSAPALKELLSPDSALKVEVGNLPRTYVETALRVLEQQLDGQEPPHVNPVPVTVLTDETPEDEVTHYYETQYGGEL